MFDFLIFSCLEFTKLVFYILNNTFLGTFIAGFLLFALGRKFVLDNFLPGRMLDLKMQIIEKIKKTRAIYLEIEILHNRIVLTIDKLSPSQEKLQEIFENEFGKISKKINDELPFLLASLEVDILFFYRDNVKIADSLEEYINSVSKIQKKVSNGYLRRDGESISLKDKIKIDLDEMKKTEKILVDYIRKENIILEY